MMGVAMCLVFLDRDAYLAFLLRVRTGIDRLLVQIGVRVPPPALKINGEMCLSQKQAQSAGNRWVLVLIGLYVLVQVGLPFRRILFPDYLWTREGLLFGWTMKLSVYPAHNIIRFKVQDPFSGLSSDVNFRESLTYDQYLRVCHSPYRVWLYAQYLSRAQHEPIRYALALQGKKMPKKLQVYVYESAVALHSQRAYPLFSLGITRLYNTGTTIKLNTMAIKIPPMTANAIGIRLSAPGPKAMAAGSAPAMVANVVMNMGRNRKGHAVSRAIS